MANEKSGTPGPARTDSREDRKYVCSKPGCGQEAKEVVKLLLFTNREALPAEVFASIYACSEGHKPDFGDIRYFFEENWELLIVGFAQRGYEAPVMERTLIAWLPIEDLLEFKRQHDAAEGKSKGFVSIN